MKDREKPISSSDRAFVVGISIAVGMVAAFVVFFIAVALIAEPVEGVLAGGLMGLLTFLIVPFLYQVVGRICALQIDETREETYKDSVTPLAKSEVVKLSTASLFVIGPMHMWYFGVQLFDDQWAEKENQTYASTAKKSSQHS